MDVNRRHGETNRRAKTIQYFLNNERVCKAVFTGTLAISKGRVEYILNRKVEVSKHI